MTGQAKKRTVSASLVEDHGYWAVRGRVYDPESGKIRQRSKSTGCRVKQGRKRKAQQAMREIVKMWEDEANAIKPKHDPLFREYVERFLQRKENCRRPDTVKGYRDYARLHILPALGDIRIKDLTLEHLRQYYAYKQESLSTNSLKRHHVVIRGALLDAVRDGLIPVNFAEYVEFPSQKKFEGQSFTPEQVATLLKAAEEDGEPTHAAIVLAVVYGLRRSEVAGLRWQDIDFDSKFLTVRNTVVRVSGQVIESETTKTRKSHRKIALIESTVPYLLGLKERQKSLGLQLDKVCRWDDGKDLDPDFISHKASKLMERCGLPHIRYHDLRHTAATLLATRAKPEQIREFLGHENVTTTFGIYAHLLNQDRIETSRIMDDLLRDALICSEKCSETPPAENAKH